jgi:hypothetical protein
MATPNLGIAHIAENQNQKEVTANAAFDALDEAFCNQLSVAMSDADLTVTAAQAVSNLVIVAMGALTADRNLIVPSNKKLYILRNNTTGSHNVTIKTAAGSGFAVANDGSYKLVYCDGTNVVRVN